MKLSPHSRAKTCNYLPLLFWNWQRRKDKSEENSNQRSDVAYFNIKCVAFYRYNINFSSFSVFFLTSVAFLSKKIESSEVLQTSPMGLNMNMRKITMWEQEIFSLFAYKPGGLFARFYVSKINRICSTV